MAKIKALRAHGNAYGLDPEGRGWRKEPGTEYDHPDPDHLIGQDIAEAVDQADAAAPAPPAPKK